jgi:hypothetical protein
MIQDEIINEIWRSISGYENYQVSNIGRIKNTDTGKTLKNYLDNRGYYKVCLSREGSTKTFNVHQLVAEQFLIKPNFDYKVIVDHIDRNKLNNVISNLRYVSISQNRINKNKILNTKSKFRGVYWDKVREKWFARVIINNERLHLGRYEYEIDAARAYNKKVIELFGEDAYVNQVDDP